MVAETQSINNLSRSTQGSQSRGYRGVLRIFVHVSGRMVCNYGWWWGGTEVSPERTTKKRRRDIDGNVASSVKKKTS